MPVRPALRKWRQGVQPGQHSETLPQKKWNKIQALIITKVVAAYFWSGICPPHVPPCCLLRQVWFWSVMWSSSCSHLLTSQTPLTQCSPKSSCSCSSASCLTASSPHCACEWYICIVPELLVIACIFYIISLSSLIWEPSILRCVITTHVSHPVL